MLVAKSFVIVASSIFVNLEESLEYWITIRGWV